MNPGMEEMTDPGYCSAKIIITQRGTITKWQKYDFLGALLVFKKSECFWTGLLAFCPSLISPLTLGFTSTPFSAGSLSPSTLHCGSGLHLKCTSAQQLCVTSRNSTKCKQLLWLKCTQNNLCTHCDHLTTYFETRQTLMQKHFIMFCLITKSLTLMVNTGI